MCFCLGEVLSGQQSIYTIVYWYFKSFIFKKIDGNVLIIERRSRYVALPWQQNFWVSTNHGLANIALKKEKLDKHDFPVYDCSQEINGSLHFSSLVRHCKWQSLSKKCSVPEILLPWLRGVLSVISSSQNYYLQSQHGAEPVEDRRTLHVTLPGVNCTPFKLSSFTVMDWTLSVILLTSAMFKLDEACGEVVLPINSSLSSFSMLFNFTETGEGLVEISSSFTQILGSLFSSGWPFSKMDSSICEVNQKIPAAQQCDYVLHRKK